MSYDPNFPPTNALLVSAQFRNQFQGLKTLIDAIISIIAAVVDGVTTVNPGDPAAVTVTIIGNELHFTFAIPRGLDGGQGIQGIPGTNGIDGTNGGVGPQGPPFAGCLIDAVNTLAPGSNATVTVSYDGTNVHLVFGIPSGLQGIPGVDGAPGEVTNAQLTTAITTAVSGTSNTTNAVATLDTPFADPDSEAMRVKLNEFLLAARR